MSDQIAEGSPPPANETEVDPIDVPEIRKHEPSAMEVFLAWEKLRLLFNVFFALETLYLLSGLRGGQFDERFIRGLLIVGLLVNAVFSVGPAIEGYLCWFKTPRVIARLIASVVVNVAAFTIPWIWLFR